MQKNMDDWSNNPDSPPCRKSRTRTKFARFLFGVLGSVLLVAVAAATMVPKLTYRLPTQAHSVQSSIRGHAKLKLDPNTQTLTIQANVSGVPSNTPLVMHVHGGNSCTGSILFTLQATSDNTGHATTTMIFDDQQDTTIPSDWFFNVHDTTKTGPDGKPLSIACGPIQVDSSGLTGEATLSSVQPEGQNGSTLSTTQGLTTLHVDTNAHTLTI